MQLIKEVIGLEMEIVVETSRVEEVTETAINNGYSYSIFKILLQINMQRRNMLSAYMQRVSSK